MTKIAVGLARHRWIAVASLLFTCGSALSEQVVISEIMYHPRGNQPEYIEVYNQTTTPLDIASWKLTDAVSYQFPDFDPAHPERSFLKPLERIVLAGADQAATRSAYGIPANVRVFGPWQGNLGDAGERITLRDKNGLTVCTVEYNDRGKWPAAADGAGHSLVLKSANRSIDDWRNWTVSRRPGGSPGTEPVTAAETPMASPEITSSSGITIVDYGDTWKYHDQNTDLGTAWRSPSYDDSGWPEGPGLLGFETAPLPPPGIRTALNSAGQVTFYLRKKFVYRGSLENAVLTVDQVLDDGAIYYLNGQEMGRSGMAPGTPGFNGTANRTVSDASEELNVFPVNPAMLINGTNTLAVELHQTGPASTDIVFGMRLKAALPPQSQSGVVINELLPGPAGQGFVEFYNPRTAPVNLKGFYLTDRAGNLTQFRIVNDLIVPPAGFASVGFEESGLSASNPITVYLVAPNGSTIENGLSATVPLDNRSLGRKPAGSGTWFRFSEPTRNAPNLSQEALTGLIKLNEVHFTPAGDVDWIELFNSSSASLGAESLFLSVRRDFTDQVALSGLVPEYGYRSWSVNFPSDGGEVTIYLVGAGNTVLDSRVLKLLDGRPSLQAFPNGTGEWYSSPTDSRDAANNPPHHTEVVINEIMAAPPSDELDGEFIELYNRGTNEVDLSGWRFSDGPSFAIPPGTTIPAGGYLVCAANAARMRAVYGNIPVVGDFQGRLADRGELVRLEDEFGHLVDEVDFRFGGNWPDLAHGSGSSLELVNPWMDNSRPSAWRDSDEGSRSSFKTYTLTDVYRQLNSLGGVTDFKELHFHLANDGYAILQNISLRQGGTGPNLIVNGTVQSTSGSGATGWLCQGTHAASFVTNGQLHLVADGHGDNRANRAEIDITNLTANGSVTLSIEARWVHGSPRLIAQTWDHSVGYAFRLEVPENLGTPGAVNSRYQALAPPQVEELRHAPAVPRSSQEVTLTVRILSVSPLSSVRLFHRADNSNGNAPWASKPLSDDGLTGGDAVAGDGIYSATLSEHKVNGRVVQFYVGATSQDGQSYQLPKEGPARPAIYVVDDRSILRDLRTARFVVSAYDLDAIANGETAKYQYRYPRLSNHYKNATFISNEDEVYYNADIRHSGSPWTRGGDLSRGKWKLPEDRPFRGHVKLTFDNDPEAGRMHHNRITRYWLYLLGHPVNENEFIRVTINAGSPAVREETEPVAKEMMDRVFENGRHGELYRIDDEWWFRDNWERNSRNADWAYKNSENPVRYHSEWMKRTMEDDYDYSSLINLFRTVSSSYTQTQIERLVDPELTLMMAAVRGYIGDWDSFTLDRGKNGYLYRRWSDGKFLFLHWDSDLAFGNAGQSLYNSGRPGIGPYIAKPYNLRRFYHYLGELLDKYTLNSPRMDAWLQAEEEASTSFTVASALYRNWFSSRLNFCRTQMGANYTRPFEITSNGGQPIDTAENTLSLSGFAPYSVFTIEVENHPETVQLWANLNTWSLGGIFLREGQNVLKVRGLDQWGNVVHEDSIVVSKSGSTPPVMVLKADPGSWRVAVDQSLTLDALDSTDPEGTPLSYSWTPPATLALFESNQPGRAIASFIRPGLYPFAVEGADGQGQRTSMVREAAVYGPDGFSAFNDVRLEPYWNLSQVDYRWNYPGGAWLSLNESPGSLVLQVLDDSARPLADPAPRHPFIWRALPAGTDWVLETKLRLASRQFGNYLAGLQIEGLELGVTNRYVFGIENGNLLSARRVASDGTLSSLTTLPNNAEEVMIRIRRVGGTLHFEQRTNDVWTSIFTHSLAPGATASRGGLFLATSLAQSIRVHFDYAMLIDPASISELRQNLRISEVMYHPVGGEQFEFIELINLGATALDLEGVQFTDGISFTFGSTVLPAGARVVVASDPNAFSSRYGTNATTLAGRYTGRLDNAGERLTLADREGNLILTFNYSDGGDWPQRADGTGSSLEVVRARGDYSDPNNWNSSTEYLGSPGRAGLGRVPSVVINEVLTHASPPLEQAIELYNPTASVLDITGWCLSDDRTLLTKFLLPPTTLPPGGYAVFYENQFNDPANPAIVPFALNADQGNEVWLTAADAGGQVTFFIDRADFGAAAKDISFGRHPNGAGPLVAMSRRTFGADAPASPAEFRTGQGRANAYPMVGPIVFNQIMYHPAPMADEFLELRNITGADVPLHDPANPAHTWKLANAVDYFFPSGIVLGADARLLVVPTDPDIFRARYDVPPSVQVFGPWVGALDNAGERIDLLKPAPAGDVPPDLDFVPYLLVESVRYDNREPWPILADGLGAGLQRRVPSNDGDDPSNWFTDLDRDGMADDWEMAYLLNPRDPGDADLDLDGDGWTNRQEYLNRTDPRAAGAVIAILSARLVGDLFAFDFNASAGQTYTILSGEDVIRGPWTRLRDVPAEATARLISVNDALSNRGAARFYRVVSPRLP